MTGIKREEEAWISIVFGLQDKTDTVFSPLDFPRNSIFYWPQDSIRVTDREVQLLTLHNLLIIQEEGERKEGLVKATQEARERKKPDAYGENHQNRKHTWLK